MNPRRKRKKCEYTVRACVFLFFTTKRTTITRLANVLNIMRGNTIITCSGTAFHINAINFDARSLWKLKSFIRAFQ